MKATKPSLLWMLLALCPALTLAESVTHPSQEGHSVSAHQGVEPGPATSRPFSSQIATTLQPVKRANFNGKDVSSQARATANWIVHSGDNLGMPFMLVDKQQAQVLIFDADGQLSGASSALLGLAVGDDSVPGIGERSLSSIRPEERTTPAGRFVASLGRNIKGKEILWVDYESALSLHPVVTSNIKERRAERLASPHTHDKRISYGCINVPEKFFTSVVGETFKSTDGVVYVLPETRPIHAVFASYYEVESFHPD